MGRRAAIAVLLAAAIGPFDGFAQTPAKVWRIGVLETTSMASNANFGAFRQGLAELGYVEGRSYVIVLLRADEAIQ